MSVLVICITSVVINTVIHFYFSISSYHSYRQTLYPVLIFINAHVVFLCPSRMIDWLSWPLAQHVDTWVIALLRGLAAVQKFTILIDVTLLKIELVCSENSYLNYCSPKEEATQKFLSTVKKNV